MLPEFPVVSGVPQQMTFTTDGPHPSLGMPFGVTDVSFPCM
jgi:hypothetical protein